MQRFEGYEREPFLRRMGKGRRSLSPSNLSQRNESKHEIDRSTFLTLLQFFTNNCYRSLFTVHITIEIILDSNIGKDS